MGGEPTFVSIDDMDGEEWNTAALGPAKRVLAERLLDRLRERFAPGGLLHYGQGKWYPGEPLPRWAFTCYWRTDGVPLWHDRALLAQRRTRATDSAPLDAQRFAETLARRLGVDPEYVNPAFEDPVLLSAARAAAADQRRSGGQSSGGSGRARAPAPRVRARARTRPSAMVLAAAARRRARTVRSGRPDCGCCAASICF